MFEDRFEEQVKWSSIDDSGDDALAQACINRKLGFATILVIAMWHGGRVGAHARSGRVPPLPPGAALHHSAHRERGRRCSALCWRESSSRRTERKKAAEEQAAVTDPQSWPRAVTNHSREGYVDGCIGDDGRGSQGGDENGWAAGGMSVPIDL